MSEYKATISWQRDREDFAYETYNRAHEWRFGGGTVVQASSAPEYRGDPKLVNPEEGLVAALSSCHMLTFLALCARKRFTVDRYEDQVVGVMTKNEAGKLWVSRVTLRPRVIFHGERQPSAEELHTLHERAHQECFIANSVKTEVVVDTQKS
jgi:organic hydroperoxide reductase OsmC/OhrA